MSSNHKKPRVCIIRQKHYPMQRNLRRNAENLVKNGYEVDVICAGMKGQEKKENLNGVTVNRVYFSYHRNNVLWYLVDYFMFFTLVAFQLTVLHFKKRFRVIEVCNVPDFLVFATLVPKILGAKIIFNMFEKSDALFTASFKLSQSHVLTRLYTFITKVAVHYVDFVIFTDVVVKKHFENDIGLAKDKTTLVLNAPDEAVFSLNPEISHDEDGFRITIVSTILKRYGIQTMIQAVPLLLKDIPDLKVDLVGEGDFKQELEEMSHEMGIDAHVNFTGYVTYENVPPYIARADVCVAPMLDDVGTPNKVLEYFALGKPTISSIIPGLTALVDDNCVLYYTPGNETELAERILELYHDPEKREQLGQAGRDFFQQYRWPVMKKNYFDVYEKLAT